MDSSSPGQSDGLVSMRTRPAVADCGPGTSGVLSTIRQRALLDVRLPSDHALLLIAGRLFGAKRLHRADARGAPHRQIARGTTDQQKSVAVAA